MVFICRWTGFLGLSIEHADAISRIVDFYDWDVSFEFLRFVDNIWGPHSVDRFAHSHTANCPDSFLDLQETSLSIFQLVLRNGIYLQVDWIPRSLN